MAKLRDVHQAMLEAQLAKLEGVSRKRLQRSTCADSGGGLALECSTERNAFTAVICRTCLTAVNSDL